MVILYRQLLEKQEEFGMMAHERLTEPRLTMECLLAKPRSFSNLPSLLDLNSRKEQTRIIEIRFYFIHMTSDDLI